MTTHENAPPPTDWTPPAKCCGTYATGYACTICGEYVRTSPLIELGEN